MWGLLSGGYFKDCRCLFVLFRCEACTASAGPAMTNIATLCGSPWAFLYVLLNTSVSVSALKVRVSQCPKSPCQSVFQKSVLVRVSRLCDLLYAQHRTADANIVNQAEPKGPLPAFIYSSSSGISGIFSFQKKRGSWSKNALNGS